MRLVDADAYQRYTGDGSTDEDTVNDALDDSTLLLEERLRRPLALGLHTERLKAARDLSGFWTVYPAVIPVQSADGYTVEGDAIFDVNLDGSSLGVFTSDLSTTRWSTVTYLGGFTPDTLPRSIARDIAVCAYGMVRQTVAVAASTIPAGATSVKVGDVAVSYGDTGAGAVSAGAFPWSADTLRWRRRRL